MSWATLVKKGFKKAKSSEEVLKAVEEAKKTGTQKKMDLFRAAMDEKSRLSGTKHNKQPDDIDINKFGRISNPGSMKALEQPNKMFETDTSKVPALKEASKEVGKNRDLVERVGRDMYTQKAMDAQNLIETKSPINLLVKNLKGRKVQEISQAEMDKMTKSGKLKQEDLEKAGYRIKSKESN